MKAKTLFIAGLLLFCWCALSVRLHADDPWGQVVPHSESGPLVWNIEGKEYRIKETYFVQYPPNLYYFIVYELPTTVDISQISRGQALEWRTPLIDYVYKNGLYKRIEKSASSCKDMPVIAIGVSFVVNNKKYTRGYDTNERLTAIQARLASNHEETPK